jgi:CheY-like chemotaxis protein
MKNNPLVWVIDHNDIDLLVASRMIALCEPSFTCVGYKNANNALKQLKTFNSEKASVPDIILLETNMPLLDGAAFTEACFQMNWSYYVMPKLLVLSSEILSPKYKLLLEQKQLNGYLEKPICVQSLCLNLRSLVN